jgi:hypothetical protein
MSGRIWPGALCRIVHPLEYGRIVEALHIVTSIDQGREGKPLSVKAIGAWMCEFQGAPWEQPGMGLVRFAPIHERWLAPILPPPVTESTEDRAPVGEIVGV